MKYFYFQLATILKDASFPDIGNTLNYIKAFKKIVENINLSESEIEINEKFIEKLKSLEVTNSDFWQVNI